MYLILYYISNIKYINYSTHLNNEILLIIRVGSTQVVLNSPSSNEKGINSKKSFEHFEV